MTVTRKGTRPGLPLTFFYLSQCSCVDPLARRVAARWGRSVAMSGENPVIPAWVFEWGDALVKTAYADIVYKTVPEMPAVQTDEQIFDLARESIDILLPKFVELLHAKFREKFHANVSATRQRIFYFFAPHNPLENIAVSMMVKQAKVILSVAYVPVDLHGKADHRAMIEARELVQDPEMTGLALMRLGRKVLSRVQV
jgi:hypothetical protein